MDEAGLSGIDLARNVSESTTQDGRGAAQIAQALASQSTTSSLQNGAKGKRRAAPDASSPRKKRAVTHSEKEHQPSSAPVKASRGRKLHHLYDDATSKSATEAISPEVSAGSLAPANELLPTVKPQRRRKRSSTIAIDTTSTTTPTLLPPEPTSDNNCQDSGRPAAGLKTEGGPSSVSAIPRRPRGRPKKIIDPAVQRETTARTPQNVSQATLDTHTKKAQVVWKLVPPSSVPSANLSLNGQSVLQNTLRPRVWALGKEDLMQVIPELSPPKSINGLTWKYTETPMLVLEDHTIVEWGIDRLDQLRVVDLSMTRDYKIKPDPLSPASMRSTDAAETQAPIPPSVQSNVEGRERMNLIQDLKEELVDYGVSLPTASSAVVDLPAPTNEVIDLPSVADNSLGITSPASLTPSESQPAYRMISPLYIPEDNPLFNLAHSETNYPHAETVHSSHKSVESESEDIQPLQDPLETTFRAELPADIETLINAYIDHVPIVLIIPGSKSPLEAHHDFPYLFLGFYELSAVQETHTENAEPAIAHNSGRVTWRFRLTWSPGGEYLLRYPEVEVARPWWRSKPFNREAPIQILEMSSSPLYQTQRDSRLAGREIAYDVGEGYSCLFPAHIAHMQTDLDNDEHFPEGWHCSNCGLLNPRKFFRHQICLNARCPDNEDQPGYSFDIHHARPPSESTPLAAPRQHPSGTSKFETALDDMLIYDYPFAPGLLKHIFTCNRSCLQDDASELFNDIQRNVVLTRLPSNSYFMFISGSDFMKLSQQSSQYASASGTLNQVRNVFATLASTYGKLTFDQSLLDVTILAWASPGSERARMTLNAKQHHIIILCLGNSVVVSFHPLTTKPSKSRANVSIATPTRRVHPVSKLCDVAPEEEKAEISSPDQPNGLPVVSLVHGDALILTGQNVEFHVKRNYTTTIIIIASIASEQISKSL